jgi:hypothetical protein
VCANFRICCFLSGFLWKSLTNSSTDKHNDIKGSVSLWWWIIAFIFSSPPPTLLLHLLGNLVLKSVWLIMDSSETTTSCHRPGKNYTTHSRTLYHLYNKWLRPERTGCLSNTRMTTKKRFRFDDIRYNRECHSQFNSIQFGVLLISDANGFCALVRCCAGFYPNRMKQQREMSAGR